MVALTTFIGYIYLPFHAPKKLSKTESHIEVGILDFPPLKYIGPQRIWIVNVFSRYSTYLVT